MKKADTAEFTRAMKATHTILLPYISSDYCLPTVLLLGQVRRVGITGEPYSVVVQRNGMGR